VDDDGRGSRAERVTAVVYGAACYLVFLAAFPYAIGFVGDFGVPKTIDSGPTGRTMDAVVIDVSLLLLFAVPHSVMARPGFKRWWTRFAPWPLERSTYVLQGSLLLGLLFWQWRPLPAVVWDIGDSAVRWLLLGVFWAGWAVALVSTFLIDHFDLFGLKQVFSYATGRPYAPPAFRIVGLYRRVRHPLMSGFLLAFWAAPTMTVGRLLFAATTTGYVLVALRLEERDLVAFHGEEYRAYRRRVGMLLPTPRPAKSPTASRVAE